MNKVVVLKLVHTEVLLVAAIWFVIMVVLCNLFLTKRDLGGIGISVICGFAAWVGAAIGVIVWITLQFNHQ